MVLKLPEKYAEIASLRSRLSAGGVSDKCVCGCEYFVWWKSNQGQYSGETYWAKYDREKHPRAVCHDCNRDVPNSTTKKEGQL
jgi:hypothetical protein